MTAVLPLRGALLASGVLFGAQHMQARPSYHPSPAQHSITLFGAQHMQVPGYPGYLVITPYLFGAQHMQVGLLLPLSVTGFVWGVLYVGSGNLLVPILIHALWNTRVFLGSYLGL